MTRGEKNNVNTSKFNLCVIEIYFKVKIYYLLCSKRNIKGHQFSGPSINNSLVYCNTLNICV